MAPRPSRRTCRTTPGSNTASLRHAAPARCARARGLKATAFINAQCADVYPSLAKAVAEADWELVGHGWFQRSLKQSHDEAAEIRQCLDRLERLSGRKVRGWFGAGGGETHDTPDHLKAAGLDFIHDWLVDDLPCWMTTTGGPLLCLPYTWEMNDVPLWVIQSQSTDEMLKRLRGDARRARARIAAAAARAFDRAASPHRRRAASPTIRSRSVLDVLARRSDTVFVTSSEIADWFMAADKTGRSELAAAAKARGA